MLESIGLTARLRGPGRSANSDEDTDSCSMAQGPVNEVEADFRLKSVGSAGVFNAPGRRENAEEDVEVWGVVQQVGTGCRLHSNSFST